MTVTQFPFLPGLDLSEALYREAVRPILSRNFPDLATSAALLGSGSEVLGFDTPQSPDHDWGPRLMLFLFETDFPRYRDAIDEALRRELPHDVRGFPIDQARRDAPPSGDPAYHQVQILTVRQLFRSTVKVDIEQEITPLDWVLVPQQQLRSLTAGRVFEDGLGQLEHARAKLAYYPHDVWLYLLAAQWMRISQEEPFMGRTGQAGDEIGSRLVATRLVKDLMNLGFLMERQYATYIKWFGTAFSKLDCARVFTRCSSRSSQQPPGRTARSPWPARWRPPHICTTSSPSPRRCPSRLSTSITGRSSSSGAGASSRPSMLRFTTRACWPCPRSSAASISTWIPLMRSIF